MRLRILLLAFLSTFLILTPAALAFNPLERACSGKAANGPVCKSNNAQGTTVNPVVETIHDVVDILSLLAGVVAVIIIIYSGIRMILSGSNPESIKTARSSLFGALIGLAIIILSWTIISVILNALG